MQSLIVLASLVSELAGGQNLRPSLPRNYGLPGKKIFLGSSLKGLSTM